MHPDEQARQDLALSIRFALKHKIIYRETKRAIRSLPDDHIAAMANEIAAHLLLSGWKHMPRRMGSPMDGMREAREAAQGATPDTTRDKP